MLFNFENIEDVAFNASLAALHARLTMTRRTNVEIKHCTTCVNYSLRQGSFSAAPCIRAWRGISTNNKRTDTLRECLLANFIIMPWLQSDDCRYLPLNICCHPNSNLRDAPGAPRRKYVTGWVIGVTQKLTQIFRPRTPPLILTGVWKCATFGLYFQQPSRLWGARVWKLRNR